MIQDPPAQASIGKMDPLVQGVEYGRQQLSFVRAKRKTTFSTAASYTIPKTVSTVSQYSLSVMSVSHRQFPDVLERMPWITFKFRIRAIPIPQVPQKRGVPRRAAGRALGRAVPAENHVPPMEKTFPHLLLHLVLLL